MTEINRESQYDQVPADFPALIAGAISGAQPKLSMVQYEGHFYQTGNTPPERYERWRKYEDLAHVFVQKCLNNEHGKYDHLSRQEILEQYLDRLIKLKWGTAGECRWLIRRTALLLGWVEPQNATEPQPQTSAQ